MPRHLKPALFVIEGLNAFATTFFFFYLFFFMHARFGFGDGANLCLGALNGFVYAIASWLGGRFAQRRGYFPSLWIGFAILTLTLIAGSQLETAPGIFVMMIVWTIGTCFTWPTLEALACEGESTRGLARMVGLYNVVWAAGSALAYFAGGAVLEKFGLRSLFWMPLLIHAAQMLLLAWLQFQIAKSRGQEPAAPAPAPADLPVELNPRPIAKARLFLRLAWIGNPFAYIAIHALAPVIPTLAHRLELTPMYAGFFCSVWMFARLGAFVGLWLWAGWHYRFRWFITAYATLVLCFLAILLVPNLCVLVAAQILFGLALGLIYYSSLFYSMDAGDAKGEHGGLHEAAIGIGIFTGPAVSAATLCLAPGFANSGAWAVGGLLVCGLAALVRVKVGNDQ